MNINRSLVLRCSHIAMAAGCLISSAHTHAADSPADEQIAAAVEASNKNRGVVSFWRSDNLGLIFGYDERWIPVKPSQKSTVSVINWKSLISGGLMATCYLEINNSSDMARFTQRQVKESARSIADAMIRNSRLRDPKVSLVTWRLAQQDNHPVVYLERDMRIENINTTFNARIYSIVTAWKGREISFECASEIPINMPDAAGVIEGPINSVLGSIQFIRAD